MVAKSSFGQWLKQRRKALDFTQEDLAQQIGCTVSALYKFEADQRRPSHQIAELLAECLNIPADQHRAFIRFARGEVAVDAAPWGTPFHPPSNLPAYHMPLIGREADVAAVRKRMLQPQTRLLSLVGPPGIGKTRLALQVAIDVLDEFADGVFFVALASISDAALVSTTIANTLGVQDIGPQSSLQRLKTFLRDKQLLLVLDNFEQILLAAPQISELLSICLWLKVLATSRAPLRIRPERQIPIAPLALPDLAHLPDVEGVTQYSAVTLFIERAQAVKPDFVLTQQNASTVAAICARLDGLPLAIELISAQIKLLPPVALLERLHGHLMLQTDGMRDLEPRHRTLNNAIEWSYQLLNVDEQTLFRRLGVFVGGWTLEAVEEICMDNLNLNLLDGIALLLDKNLIMREHISGGELRFTMLETIREYALGQLIASGELEVLQGQHATYYLTLAEAVPLGITGAQVALWWDHLELEHDNFRAALAWSHTQISRETELRLALALADFWRLQGYLSEGIAWLKRVLETTINGTYEVPSGADCVRQARLLNWLAIFMIWQGNEDAALPISEKSLALFRELGDTEAYADALADHGMLFVTRRDFERASIYLNESMALCREVGYRSGIATTFLFFGNLAYSQGQLAQAGASWEEGLALQRVEDNRWVMSTLLAQLAMVALDQGDYRLAQAQLTESLTILWEMDERWQIAHTLEVFACFCALQGQQSENKLPYLLRSARIFGAAEKLRETIAAPVLVFQRHFNERGVASLRAQLDEIELVAAWEAGRKMRLDQVVEYALSK
ncbi:MAG: tetratricopeptide repeat protein [Anaerolineaceae bacterium]|nr:tetratricopeptide repeat protein [Anaerolineaceae bacterium]